jgi:polysaccharide biosynthesis protein PslH
MKILWLKSDLLLPLDKGGKLRTWHLMRHLSRRHAITYLAFADPRTPAGQLDGMREVAATVEVVRRTDPPKGSMRFYAGAAAHLLDPLPYAVGKYRSREYRRRLRQRLAQDRFDLVVCDFLVPAVNMPHRLPCPSVVFTHNVEAEIWRRHAETASNPMARRLLRTQHRRMLRFERSTLARFDGILAVSETDRAMFHQLYPATADRPTHVVPTGVDTHYFTAEPSDPASREIVFTGSMDWLPNEDAMQFFCRDVLPLIRREEPSVQISIVGRAPTPTVSRLAVEAGIRVTGGVPDVRPYIRDAAVYVVPLRIGGGTRLKIFEAMAMGRAVVSTPVGAEGLPVVDGRHIVLAHEPTSFARSVVRLMRDMERRRAIEQAARTLVVERYDWSAVSGELETALLHIANGSSEKAAQACESQSLVLDT